MWLTLGMVSVAGIAGLAYLLNSGPITKGQDKKPAAKKGFASPVFVTHVRFQEVEPRQKFVGTVIPLRSSKVGSAASGRVEQFLTMKDGPEVKEGSRVRKSQPIAQLRTGIIQAELDNALALVKLREHQVKELRASWGEEKRQAQARITNKQALLKYLKGRQQRLQGLSKANSISRDQLLEVLSLSEQAQAGLVEATAALNLLDVPREENILQAEAMLKAAKEEARRLDEQLQRYTIRAPFDGYVVAKHTEVGEWVLQGALMVEIAELDHVHIEVQVVEDYISTLRIGQKVEVQVTAYPQKTFIGIVDAILPKGNAKSRTFPVKIKVNNPSSHFSQALPRMMSEFHPLSRTMLSPLTHPKICPELIGNVGNIELKAGMMAWVKLPTERKQKALMVPRDALVSTANGQVIFLVDPESAETIEQMKQKEKEKPGNGKSRMVPVELGLSEDDWIQVIGDVRPNDIVVTQGNERLRQMGQAVSMTYDKKYRD